MSASSFKAGGAPSTIAGNSVLLSGAEGGWIIYHIAVGGGYRFISGARLDGLRDADLRGASVSLSFKFGRF